MNTSSNIRFNKRKLPSSGLKSLLGIALISSTMVNIADASPWPVGVVDQATTQSQQTITIPVIANDVGTGLEIIQVNTRTSQLGSASISTDKQSVTYQSANGFVGTDSFWYAFKDDQGRTNAAKVTVTVTSLPVRPPEWPRAVSESPEVNFNEATEIAVLDNDQGVGLTITNVNTTSSKYGSVSISSDSKKLIYTPPQDYSGNDEFWYVFRDSWGRTNAGKVTPVVLAEQTTSPWPTATPDYVSTISTRSIVIPVLKNDLGDALKIIEVNNTTVAAGKASIKGQYIRYIPPANFSGQDSFWYAFEDAEGRTNSAQVFVDVTKNNQLSSLSFCGTTYFTDGTLANTVTSDEYGPDDASVELDTSVAIEAFLPAVDALAIVGNRRYLLETNGDNKQLVVEESGQRTIIHPFSPDRIYGVGIRNNTFFFSTVAVDAYENPNQGYHGGYRNNFLSHNGLKLQKIGSYLLRSKSDKIELMKTQQSILFRFTGYKNDSDGNVIPVALNGSTTYTHQYHEISDQGGKVLYLGNNTYDTSFGPSYKRSSIQKLLSYDHYFIRSGKRTSQSGSLPGSTNYFLNPYDKSAVLDKAVLSNDRLLVTTTAHADVEYRGPYDGRVYYPAKLLSFDSTTGKFTTLATCSNN